MFTLIWILFVMFILILVAISECQIAKQDKEWMKEAERSIRENREDWLIYFGVKE